MSLRRAAQALSQVGSAAGKGFAEGAFTQSRGMAGAPAGVWKLDKIVPKEPSKKYTMVATGLGALFWAHVTIRMYEGGADKFIGHHRNWIVDLEQEKVYDTAHDDYEDISSKAITDNARVNKWAGNK